MVAAMTGESADDFTAIHIALEPALRRYVNRLLHYSGDVEDVLQETFIALYQNLARIYPPENVRPYAFRIARNRCYDLMRRDRDAVSLDDEQHPITFTLTDGKDTEEVTHWLLLKVEVEEAINRLPEAQRETLILYSEEGMSYAEIADVTEVSIGTVKSRLFHAKRTLRGMIRPEVLVALQEGEV